MLLNNHILSAAIILFLFLVFFALYKNGWNLIEKQYKFQGDFGGEKIRGDNGIGIDFDWYVLWNGKCRTRCRVDIRVSASGLYLRPFNLIDLLLHSPVFIPWADVSDEWFSPSIAGIDVDALFNKIAGAPPSKAVLLSFARTPSIRLQMPLFIAQKIKTCAQENWKTHVV
jgi:hypothetical protein